MPTVTGFTKKRIDDMVDDIIDGTTQQNDNLILQKRGGDEVVVGNIRGVQGDPGDPGDITEQDVFDAYSEYVPGPWFPLTLSTGWAPAYAEMFGPPSYRKERDRVRFSGMVQWTNATVAPGGSTYICAALPAEFEPLYDIMGSSARYISQVGTDLRYYTDRRLLVVNFINPLVNGELIALGDMTFDLT